MINNICKIFTQIIYNRLKHWSELNNILKENQNGFRKHRRTMDNIFSLAALINLQLRLKNGAAYVAFIDIKRAFDSINDEQLWEKLHKPGVSNKSIRIMRSIIK